MPFSSTHVGRKVLTGFLARVMSNFFDKSSLAGVQLEFSAGVSCVAPLRPDGGALPPPARRVGEGRAGVHRGAMPRPGPVRRPGGPRFWGPGLYSITFTCLPRVHAKFYKYLYVCMPTRTYAYMHVCISVCMYVCMYVYPYVHMFVHTNVHIYSSIRTRSSTTSHHGNDAPPRPATSWPTPSSATWPIRSRRSGASDRPGFWSYFLPLWFL